MFVYVNNSMVALFRLHRLLSFLDCTGTPEVPVLRWSKTLPGCSSCRSYYFRCHTARMDHRGPAALADCGQSAVHFAKPETDPCVAGLGTEHGVFPSSRRGGTCVYRPTEHRGGKECRRLMADLVVDPSSVITVDCCRYRSR